MMICFAVPTILLLSAMRGSHLPPWIALVIGGAIGTIIGPAVLLTTNTSGSSLNLRPDRVLAVMHICGRNYVGLMLLWLFTWPIYFFLGWIGFLLIMRDTFSLSLTHSDIPGGWFLTLPALVVGVFLMHWFSWYLGLIYKAHHAEFPWVLQRHVRDPNRLRTTHADKLGRRHRHAGHLPPPMPPPPPPAGPTSVSRTGGGNW
jgi:hypothetical protein